MKISYDFPCGLPPAEPVNKIGSDIFKYTPPVGKDENFIYAKSIKKRLAKTS